MNFAVFILSHGRADKVFTYDLLRESGYTGRIYILIDNEDDQEPLYRERYGDAVLVFDKRQIASTFDCGDNFKDRRKPIFARNKCFELAKSMGLDYFVELDDDYDALHWRWVDGKTLMMERIKDFDSVCRAMVGFLESSGADSVALAQGGDFIGGAEGGNAKKPLLRKAMNSFFCSVKRPFTFVGGINDDVTTYCVLGSRGDLFLTITCAMVNQKPTQTNQGGMTEVYLDNGTYMKSFYSVMYCPSFVKISVMGDVHKRVHHLVKWNNGVPKIIDEGWKK